MRCIAELCFQQDRIALFIFRTTLPVGLLLELVLGVWIATLDHEAWNNPMKDRAIVESRICQLYKVLNMPRRQLGKEFDVHVPEFGFDNGFRTWIGRRGIDGLGLWLPSTSRENNDSNECRHRYLSFHGAVSSCITLSRRLFIQQSYSSSPLVLSEDPARFLAN